MNKTIDKLNWRYATKKFDSSKKISNEDLNTLLEATRLSASSYGLQPYHVLVIENNEIREKLRPASWGQSQITDASHLIIFTNKTTFEEDLVDDYLKIVGNTRGIAEKDLKGYSDFMKSKLMQLSDAEKEVWTANQVYLALGNVMTIAAELEIDTCPMEGFETEKYNDILGLNDKNLNASVVLAVGYRSQEDETQHYPKVRKSTKELFTHI
ncbi:NAD(P)H-dependent oxidoreductase [Maribacter aestuarii]|uniref:NAD(P)H-dependent oxidoreductase n=1 Tax=Maribacter aestuarii TaxID=1130723 RepID=UPI00248B46F9|nr:NAD(P)H-dependent oxidoreductase [Maribacter aestuarii]